MENLRIRVEELINKYTSIDDEKEKLQRLVVIRKILEDEKCFYKMTSKTAYNILNDLEYKNIEKEYKKLVSFKNLV